MFTFLILLNVEAANCNNAELSTQLCLSETFLSKRNLPFANHVLGSMEDTFETVVACTAMDRPTVVGNSRRDVGGVDFKYRLRYFNILKYKTTLFCILELLLSIDWFLMLTTVTQGNVI